ncbi:cation transporter [Marinobacter caseinilyticus]|uniref:cation transporter n=1 Tax=Marinobacter caseinilyticus TaxID=2692195 RepID=UPI0014095A4A|nr:cation transporter [Marinobacter caseinilyticus]
MRLKPTAEKRILMISALSAGVFAIAGIGWGLWIGSLVIVFDGLYSLVSLGLSLLSMFALRLVQKPADARFNFGRLLVEPLVVALKGLVITVVCVASLVAACSAILEGGRLVSAELAIGFGVIGAVGCFATWKYLDINRKLGSSSLVAAESRQWLMDTVISVAVLCGFLIASALINTRFHALAAYADPVMVVLASVYFMTVPLKMTWAALREAMLAIPEPSLCRLVFKRLAVQGIGKGDVRMTKVGSHLIVDIDAPLAELTDLTTTREQLERSFDDLPLQSVVRVNFYASDTPLLAAC